MLVLPPELRSESTSQQELQTLVLVSLWNGQSQTCRPWPCCGLANADTGTRLHIQTATQICVLERSQCQLRSAFPAHTPGLGILHTTQLLVHTRGQDNTTETHCAHATHTPKATPTATPAHQQQHAATAAAATAATHALPHSCCGNAGGQPGCCCFTGWQALQALLVLGWVVLRCLVSGARSGAAA
jgi:hypothetical protein